MKESEKAKRITGVKPKRVKIGMDWEGAVGKALDKKRPKYGWPKEEKDKK
ncbi:hypothetical protein MNBD_GAMMA23-778 [hydrothermal vent metagenome]|uniref:Uncharacterized protein n=1 Tax=hydrothermal vent metagenome TaxID=652676 RepID=A0A3B1AEB9_9ZZZZ